MWTVQVVVDPQVFGESLSFGQRIELLTIQVLVTHPAVKRFDPGVPPRRSGVDEISPSSYRLSTLVPEIRPDGCTFNQFLIDDDEHLLIHTGHGSSFSGDGAKALNDLAASSEFVYLSYP